MDGDITLGHVMEAPQGFPEHVPTSHVPADILPNIVEQRLCVGLESY